MEDITRHRQAIAENIAKAFGEDIEKAHKEGDIHPNGKWYWKSSANGGKGDWRVIRNKKGTTGNASADNAGKTNTKSSSTSQSSENNKSANTVTHDINGTKVTVTKNSDGSYTLEANGKKVKSDDPSYYVFGTNLKPRIKRALAQEVGLETKKKGDNKKEYSIYGDNGYMSKEFLSYLEENKDVIWPRRDWSEYKNIKVHHYGSKDSNYVAITGTNENGVSVQIDDGYITGQGTGGNHPVRPNATLKFLTEQYKKHGQIAPKKSQTKEVPNTMVEIHKDLDKKYEDEIKPFTYTSNGVSDLKKQGKTGYALWVGFEHAVRGRQPVDRTKMKNFVQNTAIKHLLKEVNDRTGKKISEKDVKIDDRWDSTDMFRIYVEV